jgi:predicted transcriptional regulator
MAPEDGTDTNHWTVNTLRVHMLAMIDGLKEDGEHRHEANQSAIKLAFSAQETGMQTAFAAQKEAVAAALAAAKEAGSKAESYSEKRFDLIAEKIDDNMKAIMLKIEANMKEVSDKISILSTASTTQVSQKVGLQSGWSYLVVGISTFSTIVLLLLRLLGK